MITHYLHCNIVTFNTFLLHIKNITIAIYSNISYLFLFNVEGNTISIYYLSIKTMLM